MTGGVVRTPRTPDVRPRRGGVVRPTLSVAARTAGDPGSAYARGGRGTRPGGGRGRRGAPGAASAPARRSIRDRGRAADPRGGGGEASRRPTRGGTCSRRRTRRRRRPRTAPRPGD